MSDNHDQNLERDLALLKNSIQPSASLLRTIATIPKPKAFRYSLKILLPVAAMAVLVIMLTKGQEQGPMPVGTTSVIHEDISTDDIINSIANDALAEQLIANESDADVALIDSDRAAFDSFADAYDANEY